MKRHFGKWLTAAALAVGCTVMTANAFADTDGHWAESAINKWSGEYGIIQGYDDGTFRPDKSITRGAFAGILDRFLHFQNASPADTFSDTAGTYWEDAILKLHASGIYLGNQGAALPSSTITRQQAVAMIGRAFRIAPETAAPDYTDTDQIAEYALAYVGEFEARGYLTDSAAGTFRPADPITRAELADRLEISPAAVAVMIKKLEKGGFISKNSSKGDSRFNEIAITEKGRETVQKTHQFFLDVDKTLFSGIDETELCVLEHCFAKMADNLTDVLKKEENT